MAATQDIDGDDTRVLLVSIVPPRNDCGVRIVMYRHLVERMPFALHVASTATFADGLLIDTPLQPPSMIHRLRRSRFGPALARWVQDYENLIWPLRVERRLQQAIDEFRPHVVLTLAETGLCHMAARAARLNGIPLAALFLDWFPIMLPHCGHPVFQALLSRRFRRLYRQCDLALCTSEGMREELGAHANAHVIYPMPGNHRVPISTWPEKREGTYRIVYVGTAEGFYGRMLRGLLSEMRNRADLELLVVGPTEDWPSEDLARADADGCRLGFLPPEEAAAVLAGADAHLVVMGFDTDRELFMRTSFTTKFLDYAVFHKPVLLWGPEYCAPVRLARREDAAVVVDTDDAAQVVIAADRLRIRPALAAHYGAASRRLHETLFNPDRLQETFTAQIKAIAHGRK